jgi:hypothetical protein
MGRYLRTLCTELLVDNIRGRSLEGPLIIAPDSSVWNRRIAASAPIGLSRPALAYRFFTMVQPAGDGGGESILLTALPPLI